jgi:hypothetical protein
MSSRASTWCSLGSLGLAALMIVTGCEGSSNKKADAGTKDGGAPDVFMPVRDGGGGAETGSTLPPPPPINPMAVKFLPQGSELIGGITVGCSYGMGTTGGRWCAFGRRGGTLGKLELWAIDMSKVTAGFSCDNGNKACVQLTTNLFNAQPMAGPRHPTAHRWYGDMLVYHADAKSTTSQAYSGPVYAWMPGWDKPRKISATDNAFRCVGHSRQPLALCIENLSAAEVSPLTFDLYAGKVDVDGGTKKIAQIVPSHPTLGTSQWGAGFTADGAYFLYSTATAGNGANATPETLFYIETAKIGTTPTPMPTQVGEPGISAWDISPDNTKWFYMRDYNYSDTMPSGTLWMADFPTGANPVRIASPLVASGSMNGVAAYDLVLNKEGKLAWVAFMQAYNGTTGNFRILKNPAGNLEDPMNVVKVLDGMPILPSNSPDLKHGWYFLSRSEGDAPTTDSRVLHYDGTTACALSQATNSSIFGAPFFENSGLALWVDEYDSVTDTGTGYSAKPNDCTGKKRFASKVDYWFPRGDEQLVYTDAVDGPRSELKIAKVANGELQNGELIQKGIERFFQLLPQQEGAIFRIESTMESANGLYYYKLPASSSPPAGDAGTPPGDAGASDAKPSDAAKG